MQIQRTEKTLGPRGANDHGRPDTLMPSQCKKNQLVWSMDGLPRIFEYLPERILILEVVTEDKKTDLMLRKWFSL